MDKNEIAVLAINKLKELYPIPLCSLEYDKPYELLIATILSAQCTDARVNKVTPILFNKYKTLNDLANANEEDISLIIHSCGFYKVKAHNISLTCKKLITDYNGILPDSIEELIKLPGVGRKVANLIIGDIFKKPAYVCDTHCIRITNKLGLTSSNDPFICEKELRKIIDPNESNAFCHRLVLFGRDVCIARHPKCEICELNNFCTYYQTIR